MKEMNCYWLSVLEAGLGMSLIALASGRTFNVESNFLDAILSIAGGTACIIGGYMLGKFMYKEKTQNG